MELSMKSRKELTKVTARRYRRGGRKGRKAILDEFAASAGYNRACAALLLRNCAGAKQITTGAGADVRLSPSKRRRKVGGRAKKFDRTVVVALEKSWKHFGHLCGKRLFLKGIRHTKAVSTLASSIPVRTPFSERDQLAPGHLQLNLVAHDGGVASGEYCFPFCVTDVCSLWCERRALASKAARWVSAALDDILNAIPFSVIEVYPDNGSEFNNRNLLDYCTTRGIAMTRSRS